MGKPGGGIKKIIKKYATDHTIIRYDRQETVYVDGILQPVENETDTIKLHTQPIGTGKLIRDLPEGQRLTDVKKGWTLEEISEKDQVIEDGYIFTVNAIQKFPLSNHTECDLLRTGEEDNIYAE